MKGSRTQTLRMAVQAVSLALSLGFLALALASAEYVIHQFCPYAAVCFGLRGGSLLRLGAVAMGGAIVFGLAVLAYSIFWGRRFCAWLCPLGTLQEWFHGLRGKKYRVRHRQPYYVDRKLAWVKYAVLTATVLLATLGLGYIYIRLCPMYALSLLPRLAWPGLILLLAISAGALFSSRPWCRWLCPYAALMNVFQWLGETAGIRRKKVKRNLERCTDCGVCSLYCPMNINIAESEYVHSPDCIHCGLCADKCPRPGTYSEERECPK